MPGSMKIRCIIGHVGQRVGNLIEKPVYWLVSKIFDCESGVTAKRHFPITVEPASGIDGHGQRIHVAANAPAVTEKVAKWDFDRWSAFVIPPNPQNQPAPSVWGDRQPDVLDGTWPVDVCQCHSLTSSYVDRWRYFPALTEFISSTFPGSFKRHSPFSPLTRWVFGTDRARFSIGQTRKIAQTEIQSVVQNHSKISKGYSVNPST